MGNAVNSSLDTFCSSPVYIPEDNGIRFLGKIIPQEILCHIFSFVPSKDLILSATRVCKFWNELLSDYHFWFTKLQVEGVKLPETSRRKFMKENDQAKVLNILKMLSSHKVFLNKNLIQNPSGKGGLKYWKIKHGGDRLQVESKPVGSDPIPEEAGLPTQHCFVTSYTACKREQVIDLKSLGVTSWLMDELRPKIVISEWVSARWDCRSESQLFVLLCGKNSNVHVELKWSSDDEGVTNSLWYELKKVVTDYPEGLHKIIYTSVGKDRQFWAGHYGAKSAGSSVKLVL